jgi:GNAT superfamily N-acetyltransferase
MTGIRIRPYEASDPRFVTALFIASDGEHHRMDPDHSPGSSPAETGSRVAEALQVAWARSFLLVAEFDGQQAGFVVAGPANDPYPSLIDRPTRQLRIGEVHELHVLKEFRRKGVGSALLRAAEGRLLGDGFDKIVINFLAKNEAAACLYDRHGYAPRAVLAVKRVRED